MIRNLCGMLVAVTFSLSAFGGEKLVVDPENGLTGWVNCKGVSGEASYDGKIYLMENFLQEKSFAILTGEVPMEGSTVHVATFLSTSPDLKAEGIEISFSWNNHALGNLVLRGNGLSGTLEYAGVKLDCQPLIIPW